VQTKGTVALVLARRNGELVETCISTFDMVMHDAAHTVDHGDRRCCYSRIWIERGTNGKTVAERGYFGGRGAELLMATAPGAGR
jgi:hypothetical protein